MILRQTQLDTIASETARRFEVRIVQMLRAEFDQELAETLDPELVTFARQRISRASAVQIHAEAHVAEFIILSLCLLVETGEEEPPWVREILDQRGVHGGVKVSQIAERASQEINDNEAA